jgi:hypothetical protein
MTIDVTQEDRNAAKAFLATKDGCDCDQCEFMTAGHFAAYRARIEAAATAKERGRTAGLAEALLRVCATEYAGQEASGALSEIADELADQLEKGA